MSCRKSVAIYQDIARRNPKYRLEFAKADIDQSEMIHPLAEGVPRGGQPLR